MSSRNLPSEHWTNFPFHCSEKEALSAIATWRRHHSRKSPSARVEPERPASRELPSVPRANGSGSIK
jgi:hypothetical protein